MIADEGLTRLVFEVKGSSSQNSDLLLISSRYLRPRIYTDCCIRAKYYPHLSAPTSEVVECYST